MSGYTDDALADHAGEPMALIAKPLTPDALLGKVRAMLSASTVP
jgi:hypothetical protein